MTPSDFQKLVDDYSLNIGIFECKNVKVAGTRARKFAQEIIKELKNSRANILAKQKSL